MISISALPAHEGFEWWVCPDRPLELRCSKTGELIDILRERLGCFTNSDYSLAGEDPLELAARILARHAEVRS